MASSKSSSVLSEMLTGIRWARPVQPAQLPDTQEPVQAGLHLAFLAVRET